MAFDAYSIATKFKAETNRENSMACNLQEAVIDGLIRFLLALKNLQSLNMPHLA